MKPLAAALAFAALVAAVAEVSSSSARRRAASDALYPLDPGLRWTYRTFGGLRGYREVRGTLRIDGRDYREMTYNFPALGLKSLPMRHAGGDVVTHREGREHLLLRFPMTPGLRWRIDLPGEPSIADCEVAGTETLQVLGAPRQAVRLNVRFTSRSTGRQWTDAEWYVPGIGLVRMEVTFGIRAAFELVAFDRK